MKTFTITEEQVKEAYNAACNEWKTKIKDWFPEAFENKLEVGRIYKDYTYAGDDYLNVPDSGGDGGMFYSISAEYGRKKMLGDKGWYAEPLAQLTYGRVNSTDYTTDQLVDVHTGAMNSLIGRLGVTLGKEISNKENNKTILHCNIF